MRRLFFFLSLLFCFSILSAQESDSLDLKIKELSKEYRYGQLIELLTTKEELSLDQKATLADAQYKSGKYYKALESYKELARLDSNHFYRIRQAMIYSKLDNERLASGIYYHLANDVGDNVYYWKLAGKSAFKSADFNAALRCYSIAYDMEKEDLDLISDFASLLQKMEFQESADTLLREGLRLNPKANFLKRQRVAILYRLKKNKEVVELSEELFQDLDSNLVIQKLAGISNYHEKNFERSIRLLGNVVQIETDSDVLYYYLGLSYREAGKPAQAAQYLEKSIDLAVSNNLSNYYTQLAISYEEDGETAKAIKAYHIAYKDTKDKVLLYHLARNYDILYKDKKVAISYYQKYLEEKDTANEYLMNYSKYRIEELKASVHFESDSF